MEYYLICPRCPPSFRECADELADALAAGRAEEPRHVMCGGEVWVGWTHADQVKDGTPILWHPSGEVFGWKGVAAKPLYVNLPDGTVMQISFPLGTEENPYPEPIISVGLPIGMN